MDEIFYLGDDVHSVFLGNSTFEYGIDDSKIQNSKNFGMNAEPVDIQYAKLKLLKKSNPQLNTVYLELDDIVLFNTRLPSVLAYPHYLNVLDIYDVAANVKNMTFERNIAYVSHVYDAIKLRPLIKSLFTKITISDLGIGGYQDLYRDKLQEDIATLNLNSDNQTQLHVPKQNIYYYNKIVAFCKQEGIRLIFLNTPKHRAIWNLSYYKTFYKNNFQSIKFLDCERIELADSCFGDCSHLNYKGATKFTDFLNKQIHRSKSMATNSGQ